VGLAHQAKTNRKKDGKRIVRILAGGMKKKGGRRNVRQKSSTVKGERRQSTETQI